MSFLKSYFNTFILSATIVVVSACVPKATEKKAACGVNQAFNTVTRSCYSIAEIRYKPVGTKTSDTLTEETPKTITLSYTDANNDVATSCKISSVSANIDVISPVLVNGSLFDNADDVYLMASNLAGTIPAPDTAAATAAGNAMLVALNASKNSYYQPTAIARFNDFLTQVNILLTLANNHPADLNVQSYKTQTQDRLEVLDPFVSKMNNHCDCVAGVCSAVVVPKINKSGSASFSYVVTDRDGDSSSKTVALSVSAMSSSSAHLKPVAESKYIILNESATSDPSSYSFTLPIAGDMAGTSLSSFRYTFNGSKNGSNEGLTTKGKVTQCMDLTGSTGLTDTSCLYTPNSGDENESVIVTTAGVTIGDVTFSAISSGSYANNFSVQYFDLHSNLTAIDPYATDLQKFGMVTATYNESYIRVVGNAIRIFINPGVTTSTNIKDLVNAHPQAKHMVVASGGSGAFPDPSVLTPSAQTLTGGTDAFDKIAFTVSNSSSTSTNSATVMLKMNPVNDAPMVPKITNTMFYQAESFLEEETKTVSLGFTDIDSFTDPVTLTVKVDAASPVCSSIMTNAAFGMMAASANFTLTVPGASVATCTAGGVCSMDITVQANLNFAGSACLYYTVTDSSAAVSSVQSVNISVTGINDTPQMSATALPVINALADTSVNEDLVAPLVNYTDLYVGPGGGVYEAAQLITVTALSSDTSLIPNVPCKNYTPVPSTPVGSIVPTATGQYYFDKTNFRCYVSTGTAAATDWALYPSLTVFPNCAYDYFGMGTPVGSTTASAANKYYLDTTNNKCYKSSAAGSTSWALDATLSNYKIAYVPAKDKSGIANITVSVKDNGGTANAAVDTVSDVFQLTVVSVDDPPVFIGTIANIETNEGGAVQSDGFLVDEDEGSTTDENAQAVRVSSITTDNSSVLPVSAIRIFYDLNDNGVEDTGESRAIGAQLESAAGDNVKDHKIFLKLDPVDGVDGNSNITLSITDGTSTVSKSFSFVVHPIAALHGGWNNIASVGTKTDKSGNPVTEADIQCNYNKASDDRKCGAGVDCSGVGSPHGVAAKAPSVANTIYYDTSNKRCYRSAPGAVVNEYSWVELKTSCPITRKANVCKENPADPASKVNNCIRASTPVSALVPDEVGQFVYDTSSHTCFVSTGTTNTDWQVYVPSKVTLAWKPFTMVGSGPESGVSVSGWNVYRREVGQDYNLKGGHLKNTSSDSTFTIKDPSVRTFTDTTAIAGHVYYYIVRPVDSSKKFPTFTPESFSEVRVIASPPNYSFVHRWIVNQEMCNGMNITASTSPYKIDQTKNFRCEYNGPGSILDSGVRYYDYGRDLLVDTQESGCAYAPAPACSANGCIGIGAPSSFSNVDPYDMYYDRSNGKCYIANATASAWAEYQTAALDATAVDKTNSALNPPLTNINMTRAAASCAVRTTPTLSYKNGATYSTYNTNAASQLPIKKDYMAYASHKIGVTDAEITEMEQGFSLNVQSRCNGSSASGLETAFTDSSIPTTSFIYSLPGTYSSGIRSLYTGSINWSNSKGTESCVSRYGIQDVYGNVAEWVNDGMTCASGTYPSKVCTVKTANSFTANDFGAGVPYAFNNSIGPFAEGGDFLIGNFAATSLSLAIAGGDTTMTVASVTGLPSSGVVLVDSELISYSGIVGNTLQNLTRGVNSTTATGHSGGAAVTGLSIDDSWLTQWIFSEELFGAGKFNYPLGLPITNEIDETALADYMDWILEIGPSNGITNNKLHEDGIIVNGSTGASKTFAVGGSYLSGNLAGRFSAELINDATVNRPDVGFRCIIPIDPADDGSGDYPNDPNYTYPY